MRIHSRKIRRLISLLLWPVSLFYGAIALAFLIGAILPDEQPWLDHLAMALPPLWVLILLVLADILPASRLQAVDRIAVWGSLLVILLVTLLGLGRAPFSDVMWMDAWLFLVFIPPMGVVQFLASERSLEIEQGV